MFCRVCDSTDLQLVLDLGFQPWCNNFLRACEVGSEPKYPLRLLFCAACATTQLDYTVPKEIMFGDHTYLSGTTETLSAHFGRVAEEVDAKFAPQMGSKAVLDIGSNDGTQLKHFQRLGYDVLGVESSTGTAKIAVEQGVPTLNAFFNLDTAKTIGREFGVINASGVFFHLEELHSVAEGIRHALRADGVFVVQFLYMKRIVDNLAFDQIYHEHLLYYNLYPIQTLLARHGLEMFDAYVSPIHGGSVIAFVGHQGRGFSRSVRLAALMEAERADKSNALETYQQFGLRVGRFRERSLDYLHSMKADGKVVWGFGAPVKGNTLLNYFGVGPDLISCLVERNQLRRGLFAPGSHIPIVMEDELTACPDVYYVLAWNFRNEILERNKDLLQAGVEFFFPITPSESLEP